MSRCSSYREFSLFSHVDGCVSSNRPRADACSRAIISQLVYSAGASGFSGANGSMMIEVVVSISSNPFQSVRLFDDIRSRRPLKPFFHLIANSIADEIGEDNSKAVIATTMVAFTFSSILTGELSG